MTSSCASAHARWLLAALAAAVAGLFTAADAQERAVRDLGAPVVLTPPPAVVPVPETAPRVEPSPRNSGGEAPPGRSGGIKIDTLATIDPDSAGVLDSASGGLGVEMWAGTPASVAHRLLSGPGRQPVLPTARKLLRRLLLTAARPPRAGARDAEAGEGPSLIARRVQRLLAMGDVAAAQALLDAAPAGMEEEAVSLARMNAAFLMNDNAGACGEARAGIQAFHGDPWRKALVFCQYLAGEAALAAIGVGLLREQGVEDSAFFALVGKLGGDAEVTVEPPSAPSPLHLAMMRAANVRIPEILAESVGAAALGTIAFSPNAAVDTRLAAAERAAALGSLSPEELRKLYGAVDFAPGSVEQALQAAGETGGARGRALLYQAARVQMDPADRAQIVAKALALARDQGRMAMAVRAFLPLIAAIPARDDLDRFAVPAGRALYFAGHHKKARAWSDLAARRPHAEPMATSAGGEPAEAATAAALRSDLALWPLTMLARGAAEHGPAGESSDESGGSSTAPQQDPAGADLASAAQESAPVIRLVTQAKAAIESQRLAPLPREAESEFDVAMFGRWRAAEAERNPSAAARRAALFLALLDALGTEVPQSAWLDSTGPDSGPVTLPAHGLIAAMGQAARAGRVAETVLLAVAVLGDAEADRLHPSVAGPVVRALHTLGLEKEARALAVEAAVSAGL